MSDPVQLSETVLLRLSDAKERGLKVHVGKRLERQLTRGHLTLPKLKKAIAADLARDIRRLEALFATTESDLRDLRLGFGGMPDLQFDAVAYPRDHREKHLLVSAGAVLAIEEILLKVLTKPDFFHFPELYDPKDDKRSILPIHRIEVTLDGPQRYYDYRWLNERRGGVDEALLTPLPSDAWRLCQFELLRELSIHWLFLHEASHWLCGHLAFVSSGYGVDGKSRRHAPRISFSDPSFRSGGNGGELDLLLKAVKRAMPPGTVQDPATLLKALEFHADHFGLILLARLHERQARRAHSSFGRYRRAMKSLALPEAFAGVINLDQSQRLRALMVSAATAVFAIEKAAMSLGESAVHPLARSRLLNLQFTSFVPSSLAVLIDDGKVLTRTEIRKDSRARKQFSELFLRPLFDFNYLADCLGLDGFLDVNASAPESIQTPITRDFMRLFDAELEESALETKEGREFLAFRELTEIAEKIVSQHASMKKLFI